MKTSKSFVVNVEGMKDKMFMHKHFLHFLQISPELRVVEGSTGDEGSLLVSDLGDPNFVHSNFV